MGVCFIPFSASQWTAHTNNVREQILYRFHHSLYSEAFIKQVSSMINDLLNYLMTLFQLFWLNSVKLKDVKECICGLLVSVWQYLVRRNCQRS
jgi:hypothetical protein